MIEENGPTGNPNYHKPSDTVSSLNMNLVAEAAKSLVAAMWTLANP